MRIKDFIFPIKSIPKAVNSQAVKSNRKIFDSSLLKTLALAPVLFTTGCSSEIDSVYKKKGDDQIVVDKFPDSRSNILIDVDQILIKAKLGKIKSITIDLDSTTHQLADYFKITLASGKLLTLKVPSSAEESSKLIKGLAEHNLYIKTNTSVSYIGNFAGNMADYSGKTAIWILAIFLLAKMISKKLSSSTGGSKAFDAFFEKKVFEMKKSDTKLDDVRGNRENIRLIKELINLLKNKSANDVKAEIPKGVLFKGPPGTGKTLLARAVAGETEANFIPIAASELVQSFVGMGEKYVRDLFAQASENQPCIIFIDEIDAIGKSRSLRHDNKTEGILTQFLASMDGFTKNENILVMAATNQAESLDPALLRPGRFTYHIDVLNAITSADRADVLDLYIKKRRDDGTIDKKITAKDIADRTPGFSPAQLKDIIDRAALNALRNDRKKISELDITEAIDQISIGMKTGVKATDKALETVAIHEVAGHGIVGKAAGLQIQQVSMVPRGNSLGHVRFVNDEDDEQLGSRDDLLRRLVATLGGKAAEEHLLGDISFGADGDLDKAKLILRRMLNSNMLNNFSTVNYLEPGTNLSKNDQEIAERVFNAAQAAADAVIKLIPQTQIETMLKEIFEKSIITGPDADKFVTNQLEQKLWKQAEAIVNDFVKDPHDRDNSLVQK